MDNINAQPRKLINGFFRICKMIIIQNQHRLLGYLVCELRIRCMAVAVKLPGALNRADHNKKGNDAQNDYFFHLTVLFKARSNAYSE